MDEDQLFELQYHDEMEMLAELESGIANLLSISRICGAVSRHFGPKTFWHQAFIIAHCTDSEDLPGTQMSGQFGTGTELSRPPANIFATINRP